jgi:hypothetical protein
MAATETNKREKGKKLSKTKWIKPEAERQQKETNIFFYNPISFASCTCTFSTW